LEDDDDRDRHERSVPSDNDRRNDNRDHRER
jgi:hypothetical protein